VYKFVLSSDNKFEANLTEFRNSERVKEKLGNAYFKNVDLAKKAGMYSLFVKGSPNAKFKLIIAQAAEDKEIEPNNDIFNANSYNKIVKGEIKDNNDIDFYGFVLKSTSDYYNDEKNAINVKLNSVSLNENEKINIAIYNTQYSLPLEIKHIYPEDIKNKSVTVSFSELPGTYYISIKKVGGNYPFDYKLELLVEDSYYAKIEPLPLTKEEKIYKAQYPAYLQSEEISLKEISSNENTVSGDVGEAIILAGIGDESSDELFLPTQILATTMYSTFKLRGFSDNDILFLDDYTGIVNNTNLKDAVDDSNVTVKDFLNDIKNAASSNKKGPLYIYMVDHGTTNAFKISSKDKDGDGKPEYLYAKDLASALDDFQTKTNRPVVVIIEACKSGSFIDDLKGDNRVIITSSADNEYSAIMPTGISFTKFVAKELLSGREIKEAYKYAKVDLKTTGTIFENQHPQIYPSSENELLSLKIGGDYSFASMDLLSIDNYYGENNESIDLSTTDKLSLYEKITSPVPVNKAWAVVIPPNYKEKLIKTKDGFEVPDLTPYIVDFTYDKTKDKWSGEFDLSSYKYNGDFNITYYVQDNDGNIVNKTVTLKAINGEDYVNNDSSLSSDEENNQSSQTTTNNVLHLNSGWNMVGALKDMDVNDKIFNNASISWVWNNISQSWSVFTNMSIDIPEGIKVFNYISKGQGFWVKLDNGFDINVNNINTDNDEVVENYYTGWNLVAVMKNTDVNDIVNQTNGSIIWQYDSVTKKWKVYSPDTEMKSIIDSYIQSGVFEKLDTLKKGEACWVYVEY